MEYRRKIRSRKGSAIVFLVILFVSIVMCISMILEASSRKAVVSFADTVFSNAGRIVLSAYDKALFDRYDIFAFEYSQEETEDTLSDTAEESFENSSLLRCSTESINVEETAFSLGHPDNLMNQISSYMKYRALINNVSEITSLFNDAAESVNEQSSIEEQIKSLEQSREEAKEAQRESESSGEKINFAQIEKTHRQLKNVAESARQEDVAGESLVLKNERITDTLPSVNAGCKNETAYGGIGSLLADTFSGDGVDYLSESFLLNEYIMEKFSNHMNAENGQETSSFFRNETEYILYGDFSDEKNYKSVKKAISAIRFAANTAYLYSDEEKRNVALSAAEALTPGPFCLLTQMLIISAWSAVETGNDIKNLENGNGVPLVKNDESWMTDLQGILEFNGQTYLEIPVESQMKYDAYLRILLMTEDRDARLYRIMDLIQINMKGCEREDFTVADHFTGFSMNAEVKKKSVSAFVPSGSVNIAMTHMYEEGE